MIDCTSCTISTILTRSTLDEGKLPSAEPRWPSGNTLAFNAEDPGSTPGPGVIGRD